MYINWELAYAVGALLLVIALFVGVRQTRSRKRAADPIRDQATRELYQDPTNFDETRRKELEAQVRRAP